MTVSFEAATRAQWRELVAGVLAKSGVEVPADLAETPEDVLAGRTYDGITLHPLYTADDPVPPAGMPGVAPFTRGGRPEGAVAGGWDVRSRLADPDPARGRLAALADLEYGVTSLWLVAGARGVPVDGIAEVLHDVHLDLAPVVLDAGADASAAAGALLAEFAARSLPASAARGNLGVDPLGWLLRTGTAADLADAGTLAARVADEYERLRTLVVDGTAAHDAGASDAQELGLSLAMGVAYLRALTGAGLDPARACAQLEFRYAATADQFATIAKFRAARRIWARVAEVSGVDAAGRAQTQHAVTSATMLTRRDPWVNMLRCTLACFAAGVGGADAVTVLPFDTAIGLPDGLARRVARNTQAVLLDESRVAGVIDPAGGSWYVERLTDDLAHAAWAVFTEVERAGGFVTAVADGLVADRIGATVAARRSAVATRADAITGVSEFPNLAEMRLDREPAPAAPTGGLAVYRPAEDYERLRDLSDERLAEHGARPTVFLATLGPVAAHTARASFAANLFQAGGIATPTAGATAGPDEVVAAFTASGATVACLCGTDRAYAEQARPTAAALRAAGAVRVLLAGAPRELSDVDGYLYSGCDALDVLHTTLETLGANL